MKGKGLLVKAVSGGGDRLSSYRAPGPSVTDRSQNLHSMKAGETKARRDVGLPGPGAAGPGQAGAPGARGRAGAPVLRRELGRTFLSPLPTRAAALRPEVARGHGRPEPRPTVLLRRQSRSFRFPLAVWGESGGRRVAHRRGPAPSVRCLNPRGQPGLRPLVVRTFAVRNAGAR